MSLREEMPAVASFVDELRAVFGDDAINPALMAAKKGQPLRFISASGRVEHEEPAPFYASESGVEFGTKDTRKGITLAEMVIGPVEAGKAGKK